MEENLSGTLALDLGNTNTVLAFQDQKDIKTTLVEIPNITSSPGVIPTAVWYDEPSKILKIGVLLGIIFYTIGFIINNIFIN